MIVKTQKDWNLAPLKIMGFFDIHDTLDLLTKKERKNVISTIKYYQQAIRQVNAMLDLALKEKRINQAIKIIELRTKLQKMLRESSLPTNLEKISVHDIPLGLIKKWHQEMKNAQQGGFVISAECNNMHSFLSP